MEPEPNRESMMDESALTNDLQKADMDESSTSRGDDEERQKEESVPDSSQNSMLVEEGDCRICFTQASAEDPILELGCRCKDDLRYGHESCLMKWYIQRLRRHGALDCEICRSPLGAHLEIIVRNKFQEEESLPRGVRPVRHFYEGQGLHPVRLLFQLPREELDRLQVPLETPSWIYLSREIRRELVNSMNRQEEMHLRGGTRHSANVIVMAYILANLAEGPLSVEEMQASIAEAIEIRDRVLGGSGELVDLFAEIDDQIHDGGSVESRERYVEYRNQILVDGRNPRPNDDEEQAIDADIDIEEDMDVSDEEQIVDFDDDELHTFENDEEGEMGRSDEEEDTYDDDLDFYAHWDRHVVVLDVQAAHHLMPSSDHELENDLNEISAHVDFLAANGGGDMLYEFVRNLDLSTSHQDRTYGRYRIFLLRDIPREVGTEGTLNVGGARPNEGGSST